MKKKLRLAYMIPEFPSQTHAFFWREMNALKDIGVEVYPVSTRRPAPEACRHAFAEPARKMTHYLFPPRWLVAVKEILLHPIGYLSSVRYILGLKESSFREKIRYLALIFCAADLLNFSKTRRMHHLHVHSCADAAHLAAMCNIMGGPSYSLTLHGDLPVYGKDHPSKMERASFVSAVTRALQRQIVEEAGQPIKKVPVIWMGVDTDHFSPEGERQYQSGRLHMITVARLNPVKGHVYALRAMRRLLDEGYDMQYTIAGEGPYRQEITDEIESLGLGEHVEMTGSISEDEVLKRLKESDVFVLPSFGLGEAAPVSVMEAMACGLPVVCSIIGGTPDMITNGKDGILVEQKDVDGLYSAFKMLLEDVEKRRKLGKEARLRALEAFDYRINAGKLLERIKESALL
jgi:glycosyltransferase involved in cell wall biosynthesis